MRVNFLFSSTFWGIILILLGVSALLRSFNINIPFGRLIFGFVFIYLGIMIISGGNIFTVGNNNAIFSDININVTQEIEEEYNIIFGSGVIDLTDISEENLGESLEINTIFGSGQILINPETPVKLEISSVFSKAVTPDSNTITFGDYSYTNLDNEKDNDKYLRIESNVVFGSMEIKNIRD